MHSRARLIVCLLVLFSVLCPSRGAALSDAMRKDDPRLKTLVTLAAPHILTGEFMEELTHQTGVNLSASDATEAGDAEITVDLHRVPLADVMDALWSLMSYQKAEWEWRRTGTGTDSSYQLARSEGARSLSVSLREQMQAELDGEAKTMLAALKMTPKELEEAGKKDPLVESMISDGRVRQDLSLFAGLDLHLQSAILHGQKGFVLPVTQLSAEGQEAVNFLWQEEQAMLKRAVAEHPDWAKWAAPPPPTTVGISLLRVSSEIVPGLVVDVGYGSGNLIGGGWIDKAWRSKLTALWMLPGDVVDDPLLDSAVPALQKTDPTPNYPLHRAVMRLADATPLSVMARLPDEREGARSTAAVPPDSQSVRTFLGHFQEGGSFQSKWHDRILLIASPAWFSGDTEDAHFTWAMVKRLRDAEASGDGFLSVQDLAYAADHLSAAQLHHLAAYFPVMDMVAPWHDFFALYNHSPSLRPYVQSPEGSTRNDALSAVAPPLGLSEAQLDQLGISARTRLTETRDTGANPPIEILMIEVLSKGKVLASQGLTYPAHQFISGGRMTTNSQQ